MPSASSHLNMITRRLGIDARTILRQGQACKLCGGFSPPFDSLDFYKYCSPANPFAFGFAADRVSEITRFEVGVMPSFGLPRILG